MLCGDKCNGRKKAGKGIQNVRAGREGCNLKYSGLEDLTEKVIFAHRLEGSKGPVAQVLGEEYSRQREERPGHTDENSMAILRSPCGIRSQSSHTSPGFCDSFLSDVDKHLEYRLTSSLNNMKSDRIG